MAPVFLIVNVPVEFKSLKLRAEGLMLIAVTKRCLRFVVVGIEGRHFIGVVNCATAYDGDAQAVIFVIGVVEPLL